jgi:protein-tyrosine-phosphatase
MDIKKILFVCTGNTCRSPMAEAIANVLLKDKGIEASSGGLTVFFEESPSQNAIEAVKEYGVDISKHLAHQIVEEDIENADIVLTMTNSHKMTLTTTFPYYMEKIFTIYEFAQGDEEKNVSDPYGGSAEVYRMCCDEIYSLIKEISEKI